ncbi:unnamed protein product [Allacma fusca]|uniref:Uncharacterized protein n=1 Tax=Allacma fusca TaxID=39272 RepID=A0A8J2KWE4_9HEXA|nr:unnamed protein product [Allacma fusca]
MTKGIRVHGVEVERLKYSTNQRYTAGVGRERSYVLEGCGGSHQLRERERGRPSERPVLVVRKKRASKVLSSKNSKAVAEYEMKAEYSFRISYEANRMKPHWCMEVSGIAFLPFLSCIETVKLFTENYPEIRREGGRFIFGTTIAAIENLVTPENLRTRLQNFVLMQARYLKPIVLRKCLKSFGRDEVLSFIFV